MFKFGKFLSFWLCYAGAALWFNIFYYFFHFKHVTLAYLLNLFPLYLIFSRFVWPLLSISTEFLINEGRFYWYCLAKGYELRDNCVNLFNVITGSWFLTSETKIYASLLCYRDCAVFSFIWEIHGQSINFYSDVFIFVLICGTKIALHV